MLVNDNSLVAWHRIKEQCPVNTLSALILQRQQLPVLNRHKEQLTSALLVEEERGGYKGALILLYLKVLYLILW
jgi:hypothetical protein